MLVGCAARLQGRDCGNESTVGVHISEWQFSPSLNKKIFNFSIWDFGGQEQFYDIHQCFLSQWSLYILLFNLNKGEKGIHELKLWLNNIAFRAFKSCIIIIGTHLDEVKQDDIYQVLCKVRIIASAYSNKLNIVEIIAVSLKMRIDTVKDSIYSHASNYKHRGQHIMGMRIPASYHALHRQLQLIQQDVCKGNHKPVMHDEEFNSLVQEMNLLDLLDYKELKIAKHFLSDVGTLHYDDRSHDLNKISFLDPCWLWDMIANITTIKERNTFVKNGILCWEHISLLFEGKQFPWEYFGQYLTLLDCFEIALPLDHKCILIPSMLPEARPSDVDIEDGQEIPFYSRYIIFNGNDTPSGFWSRLLSCVMHSVSKVHFALNKASAQNIFNFLSLTSDSTKSLPTNGSDADSARKSSRDDFLGTSDHESFSTNEGSVCPSISISTPANESIEHMFKSFTMAQLDSGVSDSYDIHSVHLEYWKLGLLYSDPDVSFQIESLLASKKNFERKDGVLICVSRSQEGKRILGQLVDIVFSLVSEWYPEVFDGLLQKVPCYECLKLGRANPFKFNIEHCLSKVHQSKRKIECGYNEDSTSDHMVALHDIVPDLLMHDIGEKFLLNAEDILYQEDKNSLLGAGAYGKVYRGKCHEKSVAVKKYLTKHEKAFAMLRSEALFVQKSHHSCLVCLVGVCLCPYMALVLEEAPLGSLEKCLMKQETLFIESPSSE